MKINEKIIKFLLSDDWTILTIISVLWSDKTSFCLSDNIFLIWSHEHIMLPSIRNCKYINEMSSLLSLFMPQHPIPCTLLDWTMNYLLYQTVSVRNIKCVQCTLHNEGCKDMKIRKFEFET